MDPRRRRLALHLAALSVAAVGMMMLGQATGGGAPTQVAQTIAWTP